MKRALVPVAALLLLAGCQQPGPAVTRPYAALEEGLTLVYLNPSLPADQQEATRLQVRVDKVIAREDGAQVAFKSFTMGLHPPIQGLFAVKDGGVGVVSPDGKTETPLLPAGFPDRVSSWTSDGTTFHVIGLGAWVKSGAVLPTDRSKDGVWVEARSVSGMVSRTLYLPGLGEVQRDERSADGRWQTVNLLTQYGFTDTPIAPKEDKAAPPEPKKRKRTKAAA